MIKAELFDGACILVVPKGLDLLIRHGQVKKFLRSTGWAEVGKDPVRGHARSDSYGGFERRLH